MRQCFIFYAKKKNLLYEYIISQAVDKVNFVNSLFILEEMIYN